MPSKGLILVDFENEWIDESSDYFVGDISDVIERVNRLIKHCRKNDYKIIFTRHVEEESDLAFAPDSSNTEIIFELDRRDSDVLITKNVISPFYRNSLDEELEGIDEIVVAGILTNLCVRKTVEDAYDRDYDIKVIKDCCVAFDDETQVFTFNDLKNTRPEIDFIDSRSFFKQ